jgi:lysozyme
LYEYGHHIGVAYLKDPVTRRGYGFAAFDGDPGVGGNWVYPYCDTAGVPYVDDNVAYSYGSYPHSGISAIRRYTTEENPPWRPNVSMDFRPYTNVGDASMGYVSWFFTHPLNEDYGYAVDGTRIWLGSRLTSSPNWNPTTLVLGGRTLAAMFVAIAPADYRIVLVAGRVALGGGVGLVALSDNFGASWIDISHPASGSLDDVMGLVDGDMANVQVVLDRRYVGGASAPTSATVLDVSHHQGTINWATAAAHGITRAFIKASQSNNFTDPQFASNFAGAHAAGILRSPYHYFINNVDGDAQASYFLAVTGYDYGDLAPAVDCEDETTTLDPVNLKRFLDHVESVTGKKCIIYTRASWWNAHVGYQGWAANYPLWVAHWNVPVPTLPDGWSVYAYWQYTSLGNGATYGASSAFIDLNKIGGGA